MSTFFHRIGKIIHKTANDKGFWSEPEMMDKVCAKIALIHSECTEVLEALRKDKGAAAVTEEIADIIIRTTDLQEKMVELGWATDDLDDVVMAKIRKNQERPAKHGHKWG